MSPFKSERQRRFLFKFHPRIAKRWVKEAGGKVKIKRKPKNP